MVNATGSGGGAALREAETAEPLATIVYRSRAVAPLQGPALQHLVHTAQSRNQAESITGVMLYDDSQFFQWLEGPPDGIERVMHSIHHDHRHTDLEVLTQGRESSRRFSGWAMKLAAPGGRSLAWPDEVIEPPPEIIESLRRQPDAAPSLLVKLIPLAEARDEAGAEHATLLRNSTLSQAPAALLKAVILKSVIPMLLHRDGLGAAMDERSPVNPRTAELAELLIAADQGAALELIRELRGQYGDPRLLYAPLFEPTARSLGDLWQDDSCSEFDVTLGLCRLQTAVRLLGIDAPAAVQRDTHPNVLVAPVPGELHHLIAALDSEWLWSAGWAPQVEFPADDRALEELLSSSWVDVLDLSMSAAFRRGDSLPGLSRTIDQARRASRNPALLVVVGGRAFVEDLAAGRGVGADMASRSSANIDERILSGMRLEDALERGGKQAAASAPAGTKPRT